MSGKEFGIKLAESFHDSSEDQSQDLDWMLYYIENTKDEELRMWLIEAASSFEESLVKF